MGHAEHEVSRGHRVFGYSRDGTRAAAFDSRVRAGPASAGEAQAVVVLPQHYDRVKHDPSVAAGELGGRNTSRLPAEE
jgi:hypothetical protein